MPSSRPAAMPIPPQRDSWFAPLSLDLILKVLKVTFLHPFVAWMVPLCFRAETMAWEARPMVVSLVYASLVTVVWVLGEINKGVAFGQPRAVDLGEEVIVITGGASGLGLLIAEVYGMRGATVAVLDVNAMENTEARGVTYYQCDVADKARVAEVAREIEEQLGTPTVLINNAALVNGTSLLDTPVDALERSLATNLLSHFYTLKAFLPGMLRPGSRGGTIVTVSSVIGHTGAAQLADYAAAKAGLTALHRSLTAELEQIQRVQARRTKAAGGDEPLPPVRTVLVTPGQLSTPLFYGVQTPSAFLAPVVEPVDVAREVMAAIDGGRNAAIAMPLYARWIDWFNVLPLGLQAVVRRLVGIDTAMQTFVGRTAVARGAKSER